MWGFVNYQPFYASMTTNLSSFMEVIDNNNNNNDRNIKEYKWKSFQINSDEFKVIKIKTNQALIHKKECNK